MDPFNRMLLVYSFRGVCLSVCIASTVTVSVSWKSLFTFILFLGSLYFLPVIKPQRSNEKKDAKTKDIINDLYPKLTCDEQQEKVSDAILNFVSYDVENTPSLVNFEVIKSQSNCLFAKKARVWGSRSWMENLSLEENIYRLIPMLIKFTIVCPSKRLDAFLIELPGELYGDSVEVFGDALRAVLQTLSDHDPRGVHCMNRSYVGKRGWVFEFNKCTFFVTTFAPFYPSCHARFAFGADNCYILLQPELSFAFHDLPPDMSTTNWEEPVTVRDKIRVAFKEAGRPFFIPDTVYSPMAHEMLRPVHADDPVYEWWKKK